MTCKSSNLAQIVRSTRNSLYHFKVKRLKVKVIGLYEVHTLSDNVISN